MSWVSADLDQDLRLAHGLDDLADVAPRLEQELELLAEQAHAAVQLVALRLQAPDLDRPLRWTPLEPYTTNLKRTMQA